MALENVRNECTVGAYSARQVKAIDRQFLDNGDPTSTDPLVGGAI